MKSYRQELWFNTPSRRNYINITNQVEDIIKKSGIQEGLCLVNAMHITASVYINDDESGLIQDYDENSLPMSRSLNTGTTIQGKTMEMLTSKDN